MEKLDPNFIMQTKIEREDIIFYSADSECMSLHGVWYEDGKFRRMPERVAKTVSPGIYYGHALPAGGRLRFVTDSDYLAVSVQYGQIENSSNFPIGCTAGFDLYEKVDGQYIHLANFAPPLSVKDRYETEKKLDGKKERELMLVFPLYSEVKQLFIGVAKEAFVRCGNGYKNEKPVVFYGSSITHGACASRPGNTYPCMLSREMDFDYVSLGFGGNAKGEVEMAEYIAGLQMSVFVMDYDYNANSLEHLRESHQRMYRIVREKNPDTPIIIMSRPKQLTEKEKERFQIVKETYENALEAGDKQVWFIPGYELIPNEVMESAKVDGVHPNDLGFASMAKAVGDVLAEIL
jgi:hypothetical protein